MKIGRIVQLGAILCACTAVAHADTDYTMTVAPSVGQTVTYTLDITTNPYSNGPEWVFVNSPTESSSGPGSNEGRIDLLGSAGYSPYDLGLCSDGDGGGCSGQETYFEGPQLYSTNGTLDVGVFQLSESGSSVTDTVTIALDAPPAATPEPSSLALLGTGVLGFAGVVKRRLR